MTRRSRAPFASVAVIVCDSVGCGDAPDAEAFGDAGANTLAHVIQAARPRLPNLHALGLDRIPGVPPLGSRDSEPAAAYGRLTETAPAKDTMIGHWELMGVVAERPLPVYPEGFPAAVIGAFERRVGRRVLGNRPASGTVILDELGAEHLRTGCPIVYTSGDSVFQIAAHEGIVPVDELYRMCESARAILTGEHAVGRVIARPFVGDAPGSFRRTPRRRDWALPPPAPTALDFLQRAGVATYAVGKIHDIFAGRGIDAWVKTTDNADGVRATCAALRQGRPFVFTNLVDFDTQYGHRNDPGGYARALEQLDAALPELREAVPADGLLLLTADHGNDPTTPGTDHTRERVPLLAIGRRVRAVSIGTRASFADLGRTVLDALGVQGRIAGRSFLDALL